MRRFLLSIVAAAAVVSAACSDPNDLPDATVANFVDTVTLAALTGTPIADASAFSISGGDSVRTDLSSEFDFAFQLDAEKGAMLLTRAVLGLTGVGRSDAGLQLREETFDEIDEGESEGYVTSDTIFIVPGERYMGRSRVVCSQLGVSKYGKLEILSVDTENRRVTFRYLVNDNCGYTGLLPGLPEQ
jgi:hypothetical protein